jgi:uncharacterized protein YndB with AHSA1/START domain
MNSPSELVTKSGVITVTRVINAPQEQLFKMWSDPVHISNWWGPRGYTTTTEIMEFKNGGVWRHVMHGPDGTNFNNEIVYVEIVEPELIIYDHVNEPLFRSVSTFENVGNSTRLTVRLDFASAEACDYGVLHHGASEGLKDLVDRLAEQLEAS